MQRHVVNVFCLLVFGLLFLSSPYAEQMVAQSLATGEVLSNVDVEKMVQATISDEIIISKIKTSTCNCDTSIDAILKLKAAGVNNAIIQAMVEAGAAAKSDARLAAANEVVPADPNDPKSPHDSGIYWFAYSKHGDLPNMTLLEPSVYSAGKTGGVFASAMTYGIAKMKWKAVVHSGRAALRISEPSPEFWFYFDEKSQSLSNSGTFSFFGATSPNEFILAKMNGNNKERELEVGEFNAFGSSTGTRSKDVMDINFVKVAPGVYKVTPINRLVPGEYCFFYAGTNMAMGLTGGKLFDFGIEK